MQELRKAYNRGENVIKETPEAITHRDALEDISYLQFIMEYGYSGYSIWGRDRFSEAFTKMKKDFYEAGKDIVVEDFLNSIAKHLDFICDGHFAIASKKNSVGFYRPLRTYVSDFSLSKTQHGLFITETNHSLTFENHSIRLFPSIRSGKKCYLIGLQSYDEVNDLEVCIDAQKTKIPLHQIQSDNSLNKVVQEINRFDNVAYIKSSTFIGDDRENLDAIFRTGREFSQYSHVIWNLSNNMGGNAEFAKRFIEGLCGYYTNSYKTHQLQSSLIHAKETGEIHDIIYTLKEIKEYEPSGELNGFSGHLHVIINNSVASSGELAVIMTSSIRNRTVYGCNTLGIGRFGDLLIYYLPKSKATVWCPHKIYENGIEEGKGYEPDIWIDSKDVLNEILGIIQI
jgi:hypothetical protein